MPIIEQVATALQDVLTTMQRQPFCNRSWHRRSSACWPPTPLVIPLLARFDGCITTIVLPDDLHAVWQGSGNATNQGNAALKVKARLNLTTKLLACIGTT